MALSITTNVPSLFAQNALDNTTNSLDTSLQRLSTGLQINSGADGPAAYVISQQQQAQISGLQTAIQNTSQATDLVQTADGALGTISNLLTQIRGLALDSANSGVQDPTALAANQSQIDNAIQTIDNIAANTQFGTKQILNGDAGINATSTDTASFTGLAATSNTTTGTYTIDTTGATDTGAAKGTAYTTAGTTAATAATLYVDETALADVLSTGHNQTASGEVLTITGANGEAQQVAISVGETVAQVAQAISALSTTTGVTATVNSANGHGLLFTSVNGQNFSVVSNQAAAAGNSGVGNVAVNSSTAPTDGGQGDDLTGTAGVAGNIFLTAAGTQQHLASDETLTISGSAGTAAVKLTGGSTLAEVEEAINAYTGNTGVVASTSSTGTLQLQSVNFGSNFTVQSNVGADTGTTGIGTTLINSDAAAAGGAGLATVTAAVATEGEQNAQKGALVVNAGTSADGAAYLSNSTNLANAETLTISGLSSGYGTATIQLAAGSTNTQVAQDINNYTSQTGVVADTGGANGSLRLYTEQFGQNFTVYSSLAQGNGTTGIGTTLVNTSNANVATGDNANFTLTKGQNAVVKVTDAGGNSTLLTGNGATINATSGEYNGLGFTLTPSTANQFVTTPVNGTSKITVSNGTLTFQIGANAGQTASLAIGNVSASNIGIVSGNQFANLGAINVTTSAGAQSSIAVVDQAINDISTLSGTLGAFQTNTLQSTASNLQATLTNTQSAESTIADTDYSSEIATYTQLEVQEQAGVSVLGLANEIPQNVLSLLSKLS
jgi:flagellin